MLINSVCFKGSKCQKVGAVLKEMMQTTNFRVTVVGEADVVEICGALKVSLRIISLFKFIRIIIKQ